MKQSFALRLLRDVTAILVVAIFMFPLFWWGLTSFKPTSAIFNKDEVVFFDFEPTLVNYQVVLMGKSRAELAIESGSTFGVRLALAMMSTPELTRGAAVGVIVPTSAITDGSAR